MPEEWDLKALENKIKSSFIHDFTLPAFDVVYDEKAKLVEDVLNVAVSHYEKKSNSVPTEYIREFEKFVLLKVIDSKWVEHIDAMERLRQGIHLRSYGQNDPLREYQNEGFEMFESLINSIHQDVTSLLLLAKVEQDVKREKVADGKAMLANETDETKKKPHVNKSKIGRNDPCSCGSGKKYKNCHGKN